MLDDCYPPTSLLNMNVIGASVSEAVTLGSHETRDIVLPNQTEHVSQIAVDVSSTFY